MKLRPDILRIESLPPAPTPAELGAAWADKSKYRIQIVEVGYCSEYNWRDKVAEKLVKHAGLVQALQSAGWTVDDRPHVVVVGARGTVFLSSMQAMQQLGLSKKQASQVLEDISKLAIEAMYEMTLARRQLEGGRTGVG